MSNSREGREHIFDTSCLNYFVRTGNLLLLEHRYGGRAFVPVEVIAEIEAGVDNHPELASIIGAAWYEELRLEEPEDLILFSNLLKRWGKAERNRGEAATILLAKCFGYVAVIDDKVGRQTARELGVAITGTVGIIARMVRDSTLAEDEGWAIHQQMVSIEPSGFRSPYVRRAQFIQLAMSHK